MDKKRLFLPLLLALAAAGCSTQVQVTHSPLVATVNDSTSSALLIDSGGVNKPVPVIETAGRSTDGMRRR